LAIPHARYRTGANQWLDQCDTADRITDGVNRALAVILKQADTTMLATCFYVVADVERAQLRFANAGIHLPFTFSTVVAPRRNLRAMAVQVWRWEFSNCQLPHVKQSDEKRRSRHALHRRFIRGGGCFGHKSSRRSNWILRHSLRLPSGPGIFDRVINDVRQFSESKSFDDNVCAMGM
jgi:hypothetical protein